MVGTINWIKNLFFGELSGSIPPNLCYFINGLGYFSNINKAGLGSCGIISNLFNPDSYFCLSRSRVEKGIGKKCQILIFSSWSISRHVLVLSQTRGRLNKNLSLWSKLLGNRLIMELLRVKAVGTEVNVKVGLQPERPGASKNFIFRGVTSPPKTPKLFRVGVFLKKSFGNGVKLYVKGVEGY